MRLARLEIFETPQADDVGDSGLVTVDRATIEEGKLASYEQGFRAGWEEAVTAQTEDVARLRSDLGHNLRNIGFGVDEARVHVLTALEPLLRAMVTRLLPEMARLSLAPIVVERLMALAGPLVDEPVSLVINPAARDAVDSALKDASDLPFSIVEEPALAEGQAYFRLGMRETKVDLTRAMAEIDGAVRAFFTLVPEADGHE